MNVKYHKKSERSILAMSEGKEVGTIDFEYHGPHPMFRLTSFVDGFTHVYRRAALAKQTLEARVRNWQKDKAS